MHLVAFSSIHWTIYLYVIFLPISCLFLLKQVFFHELDVQLIITHMLLPSLLVRNSPLNLWLCIFLGRKNLQKSVLWKFCYGLFDLFGENDVTVFTTLILTLLCSNGTHLILIISFIIKMYPRHNIFLKNTNLSIFVRCIRQATKPRPKQLYTYIYI